MYYITIAMLLLNPLYLNLLCGLFDGVTGVYQTPHGYYVSDSDVEEFDKAFPPKEKLKLPGQVFE